MGALGSRSIGASGPEEPVPKVRWFAGWHRGKLPYQQDRLKVVTALPRPSGPMPYFAIFDGHGGEQCADFCATYLHHYLIAALKANRNELDGGVETALSKSFVDTDLQFQHKHRFHKSGTTASVVLLDMVEAEIYVANVGDSPCIASRFGKATELGQIHKPDVPAERKRVEGSSTVSVFPPQNNPSRPVRLNGRLAVSRAIGDWAFKEVDKIDTPELQPCSPVPYVTRLKMRRDIDFIVVGSDGLFDRLSYQGVVDYVLKHRNDMVTRPRPKQSQDIEKYANKEKAQDAGSLSIIPPREQDLPYLRVIDGTHIAEGLCDLALAEQSTDNISCIVIFFDWEDEILDTLDEHDGYEGLP
eukprot:gb/GEZN01006301.1/.p1 GENE.gb/GEZN01006301.1/~~gb/GEZN01006301.1/.p1  ORF type:complete len:357 (-),score=40.25 gb/GEZN01006301.1/:511-1581(-)